MFIPRPRPVIHVPQTLLPFGLAAAAITLTIVGWAAFAVHPTSNGSSAVLPALPYENVNSVAYAVAEGGMDRIYVRRAGAATEPRLVGELPYAFNLHVRGQASPLADQLALLSVNQPSSEARLTFLDVATRQQIQADGSYDYLSGLAWSREGRVAAVAPDGITVTEVDSRTGAASVAASFEGAKQVSPVGYSLNGKRLYVAVNNHSGSWLWAVEAGQRTKVAVLSPGATAWWSLSPDGSRLAFVDLVGVGPQRYAGRTLMIATGEVLSASPEGDQMGAAWYPGSEVAVFGGPGGGVRLSAPEGPLNVIPADWSPDGEWLVASIYSAGSNGPTSMKGSTELVSDTTRIPLADGPVSFFGWVEDLE
ncbi:MAG TPA: hypothetical protein VFY90_13815 [Tepidiformaceae bacterium]|nr:hypothetical protein [Tepidiformaceae bacterium]